MVDVSPEDPDSLRMIGRAEGGRSVHPCRIVRLLFFCGDRIISLCGGLVLMQHFVSAAVASKVKP